MERFFVGMIMALQVAAGIAYLWRGQWRLAVVWFAYVAINAAITPWR